MQKYQDALLSNIRRQLEIWFESDSAIPRVEAERFLHSVKGTSGTIGLTRLYGVSGELMERIQHASPEEFWEPEKLRTFMIELIAACYEIQQQEAVYPTSFFDKQGETGDQPLVLILDDDAALLHFLKEELENSGYYVIATVNPALAIHYFHDRAPDCLILDLLIPEQDGFEVMDAIKEQIRKRYIPTTIISVDTARETRLRAFRMGADDFLNKPLDIEELLVRIQRQLARKKQLDDLLFIDELTGAYNRKYMEDAYRTLCLDAQRIHENFSLAILDLDHFKAVNDRYGHLVGDRVLAEFAAFMKTRIRATDIFLRYGGEEFVLLLPRTREEEARSLLARLGEEFARVDFVDGEGELRVTFSAGVIEIVEPDPARCRVWLELADQALYLAKELGRNRIEAVNRETEAKPTSRKARIAIVDDDPIVRALLMEHLREVIGTGRGGEIRAYRSGEDFLADAWHREKASYIVILDGMLPGMDGLEVLRHLRSLPETDRYSAIMLTGRSGNHDIVNALKLGADDYVTKPFRLEDLQTRIVRLMQRMEFN
ncbi:diguanylate cyclase [Cohnella hongkongensis]|uniref:Diguanylate cyclase n=1 Tax=Cohnella hongkongensis TaxID=178337 RepID=A0ABV9FIS3_9BACL